MPKYDTSGVQPPAPVVEVTVQEINGGASLAAVLLLLDTGADTTLLPRRVVEQLGVALTEGVGIELAGYDGRLQTAPSASLGVIFLGRIYRGEFALIDGDMGVLGRDILNHVALVFHEPRGEWFEFSE